MPPKQASSQVVNPNMKQEVGHGILYAILNFLGLVIGIFSLTIVSSKRWLGIPLWIIGTGMIVFTLMKNIKSQHGGALKIGHYIGKGIFLLILVAGLILVLLF